MLAALVSVLGSACTHTTQASGYDYVKQPSVNRIEKP